MTPNGQDNGEGVSSPENGPTVVVLGNFTHEGLTAKARSLGFSFINRQLRSTSKNWRNITTQLEALNDQGHLAAVFVYLPSPSLLHMAEPLFDAVRPLLFDQFERTKTTIFVYEDNLTGAVEPFPWDMEDDYNPFYPTETVEDSDNLPYMVSDEVQQALRASQEARRATRANRRDEWFARNQDLISRALGLMEDWSNRNVEVLPFRKRADVTVRMFEALDDVQAGVFLRLYIPNRRYQSEQFEDFLALFNRFLREVEGKEFEIDVERTLSGTTYIFKGQQDSSTLEDLREAAERFDNFVAEARADPKGVESRLISLGASSTEAPFIVTKYVRKVDRLLLESKHEFEVRHLILVQQAEAELLDAREERLLPQPREGRPSSLFSIVGNLAPVTVNVTASPMSVASSVAIDSLSGTVSYTSEDRAILARIDVLNDRLRALQLRSELDRLKDAATSPDERATAVQKLKGFLYGSARYLGRKIDEIGTDVLITYLERQLPGGGTT